MESAAGKKAAEWKQEAEEKSRLLRQMVGMRKEKGYVHRRTGKRQNENRRETGKEGGRLRKHRMQGRASG